MPIIKKFTGLNYVATDQTAAGPGDLYIAKNVVIDDEGNILGRSGWSLSYTSTDPVHSLNGDTGDLLYIEGDTFFVDGAPPSQLMSSLEPNAPMGYYWLNGKLYFGNGYQSGVYESSAVRSLGLTAPPSPIVTDTAGGMIPGYYQVALTYVRTDGQESGTSGLVYCKAKSGGISISSIAESVDADVVGICVYATTVNGEVQPDGSGLYKYITLPNSAGQTVNIVNAGSVGSGATCRTFNTYPPPAATITFFYRGRMYYVVGNTIFCSLPMMFENVSLQNSAFSFESDIASAVPLENGIWVGTEEEIMFLYGKDPFAEGGFDIRSKNKTLCFAGAVSVEATALDIRGFEPKGSRAIIPTSSGIYIGDGNGLIVDYTGKKFYPQEPSGGFGFVDIVDGATQYYSRYGSGSVYAMNVSNSAVCRSDRDFTSMARIGTTLYASGSLGIYENSADDDGVAIAIDVEQRGRNFGQNRKKSMTELYLHMASDGAMQVTVESDTGSGVTTTTTQGSTAMRVHKAKLARGVSGNNFRIKIENIDGASMRLAEMEAMIHVSNRHV